MFTITSIVIVTLIKNVGKSTFIFTDFLHFILPFTINLGDFAAFYNRLNDKKSIAVIYEEMLRPLIESDILRVLGCSKRRFGNIPNMELDLNKSLVPTGEEMHLKRLKNFQSSKK